MPTKQSTNIPLRTGLLPASFLAVAMTMLLALRMTTVKSYCMNVSSKSLATTPSAVLASSTTRPIPKNSWVTPG